MTLPNDSITVTPGSGATFATHAVSSKEYPVWMLADAAGQLSNDLDKVWATSTYALCSPVGPGGSSSVLAVANESVGSDIIDVLSIKVSAEATAALGGSANKVCVVAYLKLGTSGVGGGTARTPVKLDTTSAALSANIPDVRSDSGESDPATDALAACSFMCNTTNLITGGMFNLWDTKMNGGFPLPLRPNEELYVFGRIDASPASVLFLNCSITFRVRA